MYFVIFYYIFNTFAECSSDLESYVLILKVCKDINSSIHILAFGDTARCCGGVVP